MRPLAKFGPRKNFGYVTASKVIQIRLRDLSWAFLAEC
jgi:hypothetical protein